MNKSAEEKLKDALSIMEVTIDRILKSQGYDRDLAITRMLEHLVKEQIQNEDSVYSTRPIR